MQQELADERVCVCMCVVDLNWNLACKLFDVGTYGH